MRLNYTVLNNRVSYLECEPGKPPVRVVQHINPSTGRIARVERLVLDAGFPQADQKEEE